jgi:hypothetical protein
VTGAAGAVVVLLATAAGVSAVDRWRLVEEGRDALVPERPPPRLRYSPAPAISTRAPASPMRRLMCTAVTVRILASQLAVLLPA